MRFRFHVWFHSQHFQALKLVFSLLYALPDGQQDEDYSHWPLQLYVLGYLEFLQPFFTFSRSLFTANSTRWLLFLYFPLERAFTSFATSSSSRLTLSLCFICAL